MTHLRSRLTRIVKRRATKSNTATAVECFNNLPLYGTNFHRYGRTLKIRAFPYKPCEFFYTNAYENPVIGVTTKWTSERG